MDGTLEVTPPAIPAQRPAAIAPVWQGDRLTLPGAAAAIDLSDEVIGATFQAFRAEIAELVADLRDADLNVDQRLVSFLDGIGALLPDQGPGQVQLFRLGHRVEALRQYLAVVTAEWPVALAVRYGALVLQLDRAMRHFPAWVAFVGDAHAAPLNEEQVKAAPSLARDLAVALATEEAAEFVDPEIPAALGAMVEATATEGDVVSAGADLLAADQVDSVENVLKPIAARVVEYAAAYFGAADEGVMEAARESGRRDGKRVFVFARNVILGTLATLGLAALHTLFPATFVWLAPVLAVIERLIAG